MPAKEQKPRGLLDRLRELLEGLEQALTPTRPVHQPVPVRDNPKTRR